VTHGVCLNAVGPAAGIPQRRMSRPGKLAALHLGKPATGSPLNLETALQDRRRNWRTQLCKACRIGTGRIPGIDTLGGKMGLRVRVPREVERYVVFQGLARYSMALVSDRWQKWRPTLCSVHIIPHYLRETTFSAPPTGGTASLWNATWSQGTFEKMAGGDPTSTLPQHGKGSKTIGILVDVRAVPISGSRRLVLYCAAVFPPGPVTLSPARSPKSLGLTTCQGPANRAGRGPRDWAYHQLSGGLCEGDQKKAVLSRRLPPGTPIPQSWEFPQ